MDTLEERINKAIKSMIEDITKEELEKTQSSIKNRVLKMVDRIALDVLKFYDVKNVQDNIVITVRKEDK